MRFAKSPPAFGELGPEAHPHGYCQAYMQGLLPVPLKMELSGTLQAHAAVAKHVHVARNQAAAERMLHVC